MSISHSGGEICLQFSGVVETGGTMGSIFKQNATTNIMHVDRIKKKTKD